jgi:hypothetical protein
MLRKIIFHNSTPLAFEKATALRNVPVGKIFCMLSEEWIEKEAECDFSVGGQHICQGQTYAYKSVIAAYIRTEGGYATLSGKKYPLKQGDVCVLLMDTRENSQPPPRPCS